MNRTPEEVQKERRRKKLVENVNFFRLFSGNGNKDMADSCLAALEKELETLRPSPGVTYSEHCVFVAGARSMVDFIKAKIKKGEEQAHENTTR